MPKVKLLDSCDGRMVTFISNGVKNKMIYQKDMILDIDDSNLCLFESYIQEMMKDEPVQPSQDTSAKKKKSQKDEPIENSQEPIE